MRNRVSLPTELLAAAVVVVPAGKAVMVVLVSVALEALV